MLISILLALTISTGIYDPPNRLKTKPLSIHLVYDPNTLRIQNRKFTLGIEAIMPDSTILSTRNIGGKLKQKHFELEVEGGTFHSGKVRINPDRLAGDVVVTASLKRFPEVKTKISIPLHTESDILVGGNSINARAPGDRFKPNLIAIFTNGDQLPIDNHTLSYERYHIEVEGGAFKNGRVRIDDDYRNIESHRVKLTVSSRASPNVILHQLVLMDYVKNYYYRGHVMDGGNGFSGSGGTSGSTFSNPNGDHGSDGANGSDGYHGNDIDVYVLCYYDSILKSDLLAVEVLGTYEETFYLINPNGGSLKIYNRGGDGGDGGDGGNGGDGARGQDGGCKTIKEWTSDSTYIEKEIRLPGRDGGHGGDGGYGGNGGDGGHGGDVYIHYDDLSEQYLDKIIIYNEGGSGGREGDGGDYGDGGTGGYGNPNGWNGDDGLPGEDGHPGFDGYDGQVFYFRLDEKNVSPLD